MLKTFGALLLQDANLWQLFPNDTQLTFNLLPKVFSDFQMFNKNKKQNSTWSNKDNSSCFGWRRCSLLGCLSHTLVSVNSLLTLDTSCMVFTRKPIPSLGMILGDGWVGAPVPVWVSTEASYWLSCLEMWHRSEDCDWRCYSSSKHCCQVLK